MEKYNLLITGGCGFIGSNFCNNTYQLFNKIVILDTLNYAGNINNISKILKKPNVIFIKDDLCTVNLQEIYYKYDINLIINFAAQTHVDNSYKFVNNFVKDNVLAITYLLESLINYEKPIKMIHFSTDEIYGESKENVIFTEESPFNPTNPYSATKASTEMIINSYKISFNMNILIVRCNNVFGINQHKEKVIPLFISKALKDEELTIHGNGKKVRDFIHTDDVNNAVLTLIEKGSYKDIYNIGIENPVNILELSKYIISKIKMGKIKFINDRPFNDSRYHVSFEKIKKLGWKPETNFYEKLDEIIEWEKNNINRDKKPEISTSTISKYNDNRGFNISLLTDMTICEQFISNSKKGVIRGIHKSPYAKYVTVLNGKIMDYIIDFSSKSLEYKKVILDSENNNHLYIPPNFGHLFISLEDDTKILYQLADKFNPEKDVNINYRDPYINLDIPFDDEYTLSEKDRNSKFIKDIDYCILGSTGFLGTEIKKTLKLQNKNFICLNTRLDNYELLEKQFKLYKPKSVICAAGISGKPTIAWCDNNKEITFKTNVLDTLKLCELTNKLNIHLTIFGSGSIYNGGLNAYGEQIMTEFTENCTISKNNDKYYLKCRNMLEDSFDLYKNVLYLRIQYPIALNNDSRCFMSKMLTRLDNVHDQYVNITYTPILFPLLTEIIEKNTTGILNFVNPKPIKLSKLLEYYKKNLDTKINYNVTTSSSFCGLLSTNKIENLVGKKIKSTNEIFKS